MNQFFNQGDPRFQGQGQTPWNSHGDNYGPMNGYPPGPYPQESSTMPSQQNSQLPNLNRGAIRTPTWMPETLLKLIVGAIILGLAIALVVTVIGFGSDMFDFFSREVSHGVKGWYRGLSGTAKICFFGFGIILAVNWLKRKK